MWQFSRSQLVCFGVAVSLVRGQVDVGLECGVRSSGTRVWPFHVGLQQAVGEEWHYFCGATIVSVWFVVGSAHCVQGRPVGQVSVRYGTYNLSSPDQGGRIIVAQILPHPDYRAPDFSNDIALLELRDPLPFGKLAQPACLWPTVEEQLEGIWGTSVGWGIGPGNVYTPVLEVANVTVCPKRRCLELFTAKLFEANQFFCAVTPVCSGSGGSGFYVNIDGRYYLQGITTFGTVAKGIYRCGINTLTSLLNAAKYTDWIDRTITDARSNNKV
ncbi:ovochymase-2-like [Anopheles cruzii]|uniref:ovochymase-2-like n=1 Tax=Anopheles cruzii TaxID=68878 RepID=UPI0022EC5A8A|nr:ovochymase-2-like [Anopheles cruzii]